MGERSKIEWTDATWNPVTGCTKISPGCKHCYAERMALRLKAMGQPRYANGFAVATHADALTIPLHWRKPRRIFVNSMSDLFHEGVPDEFIARVFAVMALCPQHTFQLLTKRPERMARYCAGRSGCWLFPHMDRVFKLPTGRTFPRYPDRWPLPNVILGVSVEDQQRADERIPHLLATPAALHFLSAEPLLGELDLTNIRYCRDGREHCLDALRGEWATGRPNYPTLSGDGGPRLGWIVVGAESGPKRRPTDIAWIRSLRDQAVSAGIPFMLKQMDVGGKLVKMPLLDGRTWDEVPEVMR